MAAKTHQRWLFFVGAKAVVARALPRADADVPVAGELQTSTSSPSEYDWVARSTVLSSEDADRKTLWLKRGEWREKAL